MASATTVAVRSRGRALRKPGIVAGFALIVIVVLCVTAPLFADDPYALDLQHRLEPPSSAHWLGTDAAGRDVFSRILYGGRLDLLIAIGSSSTSFLIGGLCGLMLGFMRGPLVGTIMRLLDVVQAFPVLILGLALLAFFGNSIGTFIAVLAFVQIPVFLRLVRSEVLSVRERQFVEAAECVGSSRQRIMLRHVAPNVATSGLIQLTNSAGQAILIVGGLSFLGVGIQPPKPEWGNMIQEGSQLIASGQWWPSIFPGIAIVIAVLTLHTIGEAIVHTRRLR